MFYIRKNAAAKWGVYRVAGDVLILDGFTSEEVARGFCAYETLQKTGGVFDLASVVVK